MEQGTPLGANHRLLESVGVGASGEVWRAIDIRSEETVAAKVLHVQHARDNEVVARFVAERSLLTGLEHPCVVKVRELIVDDGQLAIVMDFLPSSARQVLSELGTVPPAAAVGIMQRVLEALAHAHEQQVVHRDVKPDNILLSETWGDLDQEDVQLSDFGIARIVGDGGSSSTSGIGTPAYMAPELIETGQAEPASDVYSAGITLYELLAGRTPFGNGGTAMAIGLRHLTEMPLPLPVPEPLAEVLKLMLAKDPDERPTAAEAAGKLGELLPECKDLPPLEPTPENELRQGTILKGVTPRLLPGVSPGTPASPASAPTLGHSASDTVLKPLQELAPSRPTVEAPEETTGKLSRGRLIALIVAAVIVIGGAAALIIPRVLSSQAERKAAEASAPLSATKADQPLPTGLTVARTATYDASLKQIRLEIRYSAQNSPLTGPFLEVVPAFGEDPGCAKVTWADDAGAAHSPSATGIAVRCGWSVTPQPLPAQGGETVTATLPVETEPTSQELDRWLSTLSSSTQAIITDGGLHTTAYPVQRMKGIQLVAPPRVFSQVPLELTLLPVWPSGADELNPLFHSPSVGKPSSMLTAIAGESGVRFADGCGGALRVSPDGLTVSTVSISPSCRVNAQVGNFSFITSNEFVITARRN
ncbi:MAG: serine/threonine-protein kinase [Propionibacteriaceae bacterium]|nr:serine/threonine-protein kinase [Propionibacteriaceae bacterium]